MGDLHDPEHRELLRRQEENWRSLPIVLGVLFLFAIGFLFLSDNTNPPGRSGSVQTSEGQPR
jgi:hypothetical protein